MTETEFYTKICNFKNLSYCRKKCSFRFFDLPSRVYALNDVKYEYVYNHVINVSRIFLFSDACVGISDLSILTQTTRTY